MDGDFHHKINNQEVAFRPKNSEMLASITVGPEGETETVYFYINPSTLSLRYKQKISRRKSRIGWIDEYWGEELDSIAVEAYSGGFRTDSAGYSGLSSSRDKTNQAFTRLESIVKAYRDGGLYLNNATNFADSFIPVRFKYDKFLYYGFFESLNLEDSAERPFMMSFNFSFKVLGTDVTF